MLAARNRPNRNLGPVCARDIFRQRNRAPGLIVQRQLYCGVWSSETCLMIKCQSTVLTNNHLLLFFKRIFLEKLPSPSVKLRKFGKPAVTRVPPLDWSCATSAIETLEGDQQTFLYL